MQNVSGGKNASRVCTSQPGNILDNFHIHLVFIGDSLTRYQFLATAYRLYFRSTIPKYIVNEKVHNSWLSFYQNTSQIFDGRMQCDCFRFENDAEKQSIKKTFSFSRENRFFASSLLCENISSVPVLFTYIQFFGDKNSLHGRVLPSNIRLARPSKIMKKSYWSYIQLNEALVGFVAKLEIKPTHIIMNAGLWPHKNLLGTLKSALFAAKHITPNVYWKETSPNKACLTNKNSFQKRNLNCPRDIDDLARYYCGLTQQLCKYVEFPKKIPSYLLNDEKLPEYFDKKHFSSPELYVFWSKILLKRMDLDYLSKALDL